MQTIPNDWKGPRPPLTLAEADRLVAAARASVAVLVEGWSDEAAVEALAARLGMGLAKRGIVVLPIGGATNARAFIRHFGQAGAGLRLAGLYDRPEARHFLRVIGGDARPELDESAAQALGFHACDRDLEDELIRALGPATVERVIEAEGEWNALRRFQIQPAQQGRAAHDQLRRFMGTRAGRKIRYGALLAQALPSDRIPMPLARLLEQLRDDATA